VRKQTFLFCMLIFAFAPAVNAKEKPWYKYENQYFEAYSDASEKKVMRLLRELENFRAAVMQLQGNRIPVDASKTQVVIFNSRNQYKETIANDSIVAYAATIGDVPYMVMSVSGDPSTSLSNIRHEFTHVLQGYRDSRSPPWYEEGFAEFMSGMKFRANDTEMIVGNFPGRFLVPVGLLDWDELISDDFGFHQISSDKKASNAYVQSWLLVHYLTLGDGMAHNKGLVQYLTRYSRGESSVETFLDVFGEAANTLGPRALRQYSTRFNTLVLEFQSGSQDFDFDRREVSPDVIAVIVSDLKTVLWYD
jgi:hypothetical protein